MSVSMFQVGIVPTNYPTFDVSSTNQYNYRNLIDVYPVYQVYQDQYYNTRQINPISLATLTPATLDPSNLPCDVRPTIYEQGDAELGLGGSYVPRASDPVCLLRSSGK